MVTGRRCIQERAHAASVSVFDTYTQTHTNTQTQRNNTYTSLPLLTCLVMIFLLPCESWERHTMSIGGLWLWMASFTYMYLGSPHLQGKQRERVSGHVLLEHSPTATQTNTRDLESSWLHSRYEHDCQANDYSLSYADSECCSSDNLAQ